MERRTIARALRAIRRQKRLTQTQLGQRIGISTSEISRRERSALGTCSVLEVEEWATALNAHLVLELRVDGERPMADARHARLQEWMTSVLRRANWTVEPEVSFNHYGERGRIDLLAFHLVTRILLIVEVKSRIDDAQEVLGRLDIKRRVARTVARERGWTASAATAALLVADGSTSRRRIYAHPALFASYALRGRAATQWLRRPRSPAPTGLLMMVQPDRAGRQR